MNEVALKEYDDDDDDAEEADDASTHGSRQPLTLSKYIEVVPDAEFFVSCTLDAGFAIDSYDTGLAVCLDGQITGVTPFAMNELRDQKRQVFSGASSWRNGLKYRQNFTFSKLQICTSLTSQKVTIISADYL